MFFLLMVTPRCSHKEDLKGVGPVLYYSALRSLLFALALAFLRFASRPVHKPTHPSNVSNSGLSSPKVFFIYLHQRLLPGTFVPYADDVLFAEGRNDESP